MFGIRPGLKKLDRPQSLFIGGDSIAVKDKLKILGFHLDPLLSMDDHVKETVRACNYHIRALRHVRKSLTLEATRTIAHGLVTARLDHCNALLLGTTKSNIAKLQHVQCDLARVVLQAPWRTSSKPLLEQLHWLPIQSFSKSRSSRSRLGRASSRNTYQKSFVTMNRPGTSGQRVNTFFTFLSWSLHLPVELSAMPLPKFGTV